MKANSRPRELKMEFSKARMAALRVIYFAIAVAILIVARVELDLPSWFLTVGVLVALLVVVASYPIQLRLIKTVAYRDREVGPEAMIGLEGVTVERVGERGLVRVRGEIWKAQSASSPIPKGAEVVVRSVQENLTLLVERA